MNGRRCLVRWSLAAALALCVTSCGRIGFAPERDAATPPELDAGPPPEVLDTAKLTINLTCSDPPRTGDEVCQRAGYQRALAVHGHFWFQCAGTLDRCPGGWQIDGLTCPDWCGGTDCGGWAFCGSGPIVRERIGDGSTAFNALEFGYDCTAYNPGWTVRAYCIR